MPYAMKAENFPSYPDDLWGTTLLNRQTGFLKILYVQRYRGPRQVAQISGHCFWELTVIQDGNGYLHTPGNDIVLKENMLILIPPGCRHRETAAMMDTIWIGFRGDLMQTNITTPLIVSDAKLVGDAMRLWLLSERRFGAIGFELDGMLIALLGGFSRVGLADEAGADPIDIAIRWLHIHMADDIGLPQVAAAAHISEGYFYRLFRKRTGITPVQYLTRIRMERAMRMLNMTPALIIEIAAACGFKDPFYFSRVFKRHTGLTPASFRHKETGKATGLFHLRQRA